MPLEDTENAWLPFWSPDARSLGFYADGQLKRISLETGFVETIAEMPNPRAPGTWIEGDRILFEPTYTEELMIVSASGDFPPRPVTEEDPELDMSAGHRWAAPLPDGNRFIFVERDYSLGTSSIRLGSVDSPESRVLLPRSPVDIESPVVRGEYLLYVRDSVLLAHPFDPDRAEFTGDPQVLLGGAKVSGFSVSETGVLAWVPARDEDESQARLTWLDRSGNTLETLTDLPSRVGSPRLSRDGRYFVFNAKSEDLNDISTLYVYELARSTFRRIVSSASVIGTRSPDGEKIVFLGMWIVDAGGLQQPERAYPAEEGSDVVEVPMDWSPDGNHIAFSRFEGSNIGIWILPVGEGQPFAYADKADGRSFISFAPSGKWVAYVSNESGRAEVYVDSFPARGTRIQVSTKGGSHPRWRRDGRELFLAVQDEQSELVEFQAVDVEETDGGLKFSTPVKLFEARPRAWNNFYDVTADGQRFLMPILPDLAPRPIHIEADWKRGLAK